MKWVPDRTGRFAKRPHYLPEELDEECERTIMEFLKQKYGRAEFPVKTDDLTVLIEQKADLDSYADLSEEEGDVEGVTEFTPGQRPVVRIADRLSAPHMENRLRTTLTHEWGHVHLHQFMYDVETRPRSLFGDQAQAVANKCKRDKILGASETDWMAACPTKAVAPMSKSFLPKRRLGNPGQDERDSAMMPNGIPG